jgi:hypothetical protein
MAILLAVAGRFCENIFVVKNYLWKYFLPGLALIACAFWVGTLPSMIFALVGFLSFFLAGVALIIEGRKRQASNKTSKTDEGVER